LLLRWCSTRRSHFFVTSGGASGKGDADAGHLAHRSDHVTYGGLPPLHGRICDHTWPLARAARIPPRTYRINLLRNPTARTRSNGGCAKRCALAASRRPKCESTSKPGLGGKI
jgi:hypothetical protein